MLSKIAEALFQKSARGCPVHPRQWRHTATAEARFQKLARGWLAYPVTMVTCAATAEERL